MATLVLRESTFKDACYFHVKATDSDFTPKINPASSSCSYSALNRLPVGW
jgi:hypothetical protein